MNYNYNYKKNNLLQICNKVKNQINHNNYLNIKNKVNK